VTSYVRHSHLLYNTQVGQAISPAQAASGVASYGALGYAPLLDSAVLFITRPTSVSGACFEMTLYVECTVTGVIDGLMKGQTVGGEL